MPSGDVQVQSAVHSLDQGKFAVFIKAGMFGVLIIALSLLYLFVQFRGLENSSAMDQAQIARNLAAGRGFTTDYIRPVALRIIQRQAGQESTNVDLSRFPDFYQSPLSPWINSFALRMVKGQWKMTNTDIIYIGDRMVAATAMLFFILSVGVWYFVIAKLFDSKLALFACAAVLLTDLMWQFSLSGLPQMLVLFLFSLASLATLLAIESHQKEQTGIMIGWLIGAGISLGLMTLAHGLSFWIFLGWFIFAAVYFRPRGLVALAAVAAYLLVIAPWMVRNVQVCGNPFGLAIYGAFYKAKPEDTFLRAMEASPKDSGSSLKSKGREGIISQGRQISALLGLNAAAGAFFLALFHPFRSRKTFVFKWCLLLMWFCAVVGMAFFQPSGEVSENQFHVLFIPLFVGYGIAFLFVLWNRLELGSPLLRVVFICGILFVCGVPLLLRLLTGDNLRIQWPPYVPPLIAVLGDWFDEDEVICSDMPWAVAWYARRKSLLLPETVTSFNEIHDYGQTVQPICGLYLTPVTGNQRLFADIYKGAYKEWALLITRPPQLKGFPFSAFTPLPIEGECIIYADRDRWSAPRTPQP
ncbi:MAG: ArnT family glycosyltransferase [Terrimicrobiaceae bacterium]